MKTKVKAIVPALKPNPIKVQLDYKTIITIPRMKSLKVWRTRFPEAKVIAS